MHVTNSVEFAVLCGVLASGTIVGMIYHRRTGRARSTSGRTSSWLQTQLLAAVGVGREPTVLHFTAPWCGPCAAVRRVVGRVVADSAAREVELDIDDHAQLARELTVLSLPTTFVFDADGHEHFRVSGVPDQEDLRAALATVREIRHREGQPRERAVNGLLRWKRAHWPRAHAHPTPHG